MSTKLHCTWDSWEVSQCTRNNLPTEPGHASPAKIIYKVALEKNEKLLQVENPELCSNPPKDDKMCSGPLEQNAIFPACDSSRMNR